jgi:hypothetical protein
LINHLLPQCSLETIQEKYAFHHVNNGTEFSPTNLWCPVMCQQIYACGNRANQTDQSEYMGSTGLANPLWWYHHQVNQLGRL